MATHVSSVCLHSGKTTCTRTRHMLRRRMGSLRLFTLNHQDKGLRVRANAGKGFGKKSKVEVDEAASGKAERATGTDTTSSSSRQQGVPPAPPPANMGDSSWASEVRNQAAYDMPSSSEKEREKAGPATMPSEQYKKLDENFVTALAFLFVALFVEGLLVAGSGFLSEDLDQFIVNFIFPAFTPSLGIFLLVSVFYGLFKTKVEPKD